MAKTSSEPAAQPEPVLRRHRRRIVLAARLRRARHGREGHARRRQSAGSAGASGRTPTPVVVIRRITRCRAGDRPPSCRGRRRETRFGAPKQRLAWSRRCWSGWRAFGRGRGRCRRRRPTRSRRARRPFCVPTRSAARARRSLAPGFSPGRGRGGRSSSWPTARGPRARADQPSSRPGARTETTCRGQLRRRARHPVLLSRAAWDDVPDEGARALAPLLVPCDDLRRAGRRGLPGGRARASREEF